MAEREKVIKEIARIRDEYFGEMTSYEGDVLDAALALLKAQEPRVMTLEEAQNALHTEAVIWLEMIGYGLDAGIRMKGKDYFTMQNDDRIGINDLDEDQTIAVYGSKVRMWTSRPDEKRRAETPWE